MMKRPHGQTEPLEPGSAGEKMVPMDQREGAIPLPGHLRTTLDG